MSRIPTVLRIVGWSAFVLLIVIIVIASITISSSSNVGESILSSFGVLAVALVCGLVFIAFASLIGASVVSWRLKRLVAKRGKKTMARIVKTAFVGNQRSGKSGSGWEIIRFDLEVDHEGETITTSTEIKSEKFDASKYPPGTRVSVVYDHDTKTIAMLNKNNYVVEYI